MRRVRNLIATAATAGATLAIAACGGTHAPAPTKRLVAPSQTVTAIGAPPCLTGGGSAKDFAMQCAVPPTNSTVPPPVTAAQGSTYGIDTYGAGDPSLPDAFDCSYFSGYPGGKDWDYGSIRQWTSRGKHICVVFETAATRAYAGYSAGEADAHTALREAAQVGLPSYVPLRFAVDTPTYQSFSLPGAMLAYFEGVHAVLGSRTGAYGSYYVIGALERARIITPATAWQTVGWSYGHVSNACIYQYSINDYQDGHSVDYDVARPGCAAAFYEYAPPAPQAICFGKHAQGSSLCRTAHAELRRWQAAVAANRHVSERLGCPRNTAELNKLKQRQRWFAAHLRAHPKVKTQARRYALAATRRAVASERAFTDRRRCSLWASRQRFFAHQAAWIQRKYS